MTNHVHLLIKVLKQDDLKRFMQGVNQSYSNYFKRRYKHTGHLWQGRYKSFLIQDDAYLLECGRYIERNPVRAKLVDDPRNWEWSSYQFYGWGKADALINPHGLYWDMGETPQVCQECHRDYVLKARPYESLLDKQFQIA